MKPTYIKIYALFIILVMLLFSSKSIGQTNVIMNSLNATGNSVLGNAGVVTYSIGQVFYSNIGDNVHQIAEGIQQGYYENNEDTNNEDTDVDIPTTDVNILIYPNPTTDHVTLASDGLDYNNQLNSYQLYNYQGKLLKQDSIQQTKTEIDLSNLSSSIYLIQVFVDEKLWKTFKIIKQ